MTLGGLEDDADDIGETGDDGGNGCVTRKDAGDSENGFLNIVRWGEKELVDEVGERRGRG